MCAGMLCAVFTVLLVRRPSAACRCVRYPQSERLCGFVIYLLRVLFYDVIQMFKLREGTIKQSSVQIKMVL